MARTSIIGLFLWAALPSVSAAEETTEEILRRLSTVEDAPLPGEGDSPQPIDLASSTETLSGRKIVRVEAIDPPAGFNPVKDANIPLGVLLYPSLVRKAAIRLWDTGQYSEVNIYARGISEESVVLLIEVAPMLRIRSLEVSGNRVLDDDGVARAIEYTADRTIRADPDVLRQLKIKLLSAYSSRGYREAQAALRIETTNKPGGVVLVISIDEGLPERYAEIHLDGLPAELDEAWILNTAGFEADMPRNRRKVEDNLHRIEKQLFENGYLDAAITGIKEERLGRYNFRLTIPVSARIKSHISFMGNEYLRSRTLREKLFSNEAFRTNPVSFEGGIRRLKAYGRDRGLFHIEVTGHRVCQTKNAPPKAIPSSRQCDKDATSQRLLFKVREGPVVEVAKIQFAGNEEFSVERLESELMAFVKERLENDDVFQPFSTDTLDDLGLSDKRGGELEKPKGLKYTRRNQSRTYVPELYREAMIHLTEIYQEKGYLGAEVTDVCQVEQARGVPMAGKIFSPFVLSRGEDGEDEQIESGSSPCVFINADRDQLIVKVEIKEGPQTRIAEMGFDGNYIFPDSTLLEVFQVSESDPYNEYKLKEALGRIESFYKENGHMFAVVDLEKTFSDDMKHASVAVNVTEGPEVRVGRIRIEGAETTSERLIRERLVMESGTVITPSKLEESQRKIMDLGFFDSGLVQMVSPEKPAAVKNIVVQLREGDFQYLELRVGMATVEGLRGGFEYGYRNIGGWAIGARLRARANYRLLFLGSRDSKVVQDFEKEFRALSLIDAIEHHILFGLTQSHFPGTHGLLGWGIDGTRERVNEPAFGATRNTAFLRLNTTHDLGTDFLRALVIETRTGLEDTYLDLWVLQAGQGSGQINPAYQALLRMPQGPTVFWVTGINAALDFRDHPLNPTRGVRLSVGADYVTSIENLSSRYFWSDTGIGPAGDEIPGTVSSSDLRDYLAADQAYKVEYKSNLIRAHATISGYIPFSDDGMVLALSVSGGYVFHLESESETWADRLFYVGGVDTLRGFPEESLIAEDEYALWLAEKNSSALGKGGDDDQESHLLSPGGEVMLILRSEFRFPIAEGFLGAVFAEAGNVWRNQKNVNLIEMDPLAIHLRPVVGGGIRYLTALGLFSFDLGFNLNQRPHETALAPFLSIGSAF